MAPARWRVLLEPLRAQVEAPKGFHVNLLCHREEGLGPGPQVQSGGVGLKVQKLLEAPRAGQVGNGEASLLSGTQSPAPGQVSPG